MINSKSTPKPGIWLNQLTRELLESTELRQMILDKKLNGLSLNLEALHNSLYNGGKYNKLIKHRIEACRSMCKILPAIFCDLSRRACKLLADTYKDSLGADGYVCVPLSPDVALDTLGTIKRATDLWNHTARENLMISIPSTKQGIPAIRQLVSSGINVNPTIIYTLQRYQQSAEAYVAGLEALARKGKRIDRVASVASVMPNTIDRLLDPVLRKIATENNEQAVLITPLLGTLGQATVTLMCKAHYELFNSDRFQALEIKGANPQRILWVCEDAETCPPAIAANFSSFFNIRFHFQLPRITPEYDVISEAPDKIMVPDLEKASRQLQLANQLLGFLIIDAAKAMEKDILSIFTANYKKLTGFIDSQRLSIKPRAI
jgi:transaldolase